MKIILIISILLLSFQPNRKDCLKKADKIVLKHVEFDILTIADILPEDFEQQFENMLYVNVYEDSVHIDNFLHLLNELKVQDVDSIVGVDTRAKIEIYNADKVYNIYLDQFAVLINGIENKNTPELCAEFEKLQAKPLDD